MAPTLDDLLNDKRLTRLFSVDAGSCALQLWILQIKFEKSVENRIVYGRLLPYSYSSDNWSASDDDAFRAFGQVEAQVVQLNLYATSVRCAEVLRQLSAGRTISAISEDLKLGLSEKLKTRFGAIALAADKLVYRPVAYLLNRDAHERGAPSSPHGGAGALSASISQTDKAALFRLGQDYDVALTEWVVKHLNAHTGLEFGGADISRFGDLELMVFPALDDLERPLMKVTWTDAPLALIVRFNPIQIVHFSGFQFRLSVENGDQITYSAIAPAERDAEGLLLCKFELNEQLRTKIDSTELEIFGLDGDHSGHSTLCCRWRIGYIREIHFRGHPVGDRTSPVKFDWLEKATRPSDSARVKAALTITHGDLGFASRIGGRDADLWVPANRELVALFARLHPARSEGRFFLRWSQGDGDGRLQFVEWFKTLLAKYRQHQIVIFDPYFEDVGLGLLLLCAAPKADVIVFTSLPKPPSKQGEPAPSESDKPLPSRINNLMASCEHNRNLIKRIKLRIYGLKDGRLHDRYILIMAPDGLPEAGFNLSNSFQKAAENYPLLITPIPSDTLLKIEDYTSGLVREAEAAQSGSEDENTSMRLLFDATALPRETRRYEPLRILEKAQAGDVLSMWTGELSLRGLSGSPLRKRMSELGLLRDDRLALAEAGSLRNCLDQQSGEFMNFETTWEVLGDVLAHSHSEDRDLHQARYDGGFLEFLARFLKASFDRKHDGADSELAVMDARLFRDSIETLLHSPYRPDHLFHPTKYAGLSWAEFFAIRFLWWFSPDSLLATAEGEMANVPVQPQSLDAVRLSLLSQIVSEISQSIEFDINEEQRDCLIRSKNGLLRWMGLNVIERALEKPGERAAALELIATFPYPDQVQTLGWMVARAATKQEKIGVYNDLLAALNGALPTPIPADDLRSLIDSMRGHMRQLGWAEPWLFQDVILPLLQSERASTDDACAIWAQELAGLLGPKQEHESRLFERAREGQTTNIAALLFAHSSPERQQASLKPLKAILKRHQRTVRQPLASTSDWARWDDALVVSMWTLIFTRWGQYYLRGRGMTNRELEQLSQDARELAMVRPIYEWQSKGTGKPGELAAFLDQVEELLGSSN
ncbi:VPA1262 family protein [Mesorhizobium sp. GbtcB19]|uniref:VPA1262 family protein n=1 Tax=Mesorhizobium sp. GbtcB19 TaxID=2824764 RepID=UPI001C2F5410|nr:VPA1262 family protein [Mesorhizobium sp. GbtcB19]